MNLRGFKKAIIIAVVIFTVSFIVFLTRNNNSNNDDYDQEQYVLNDKGNVLEIYNVINKKQRLISSISKETILGYVKNKIITEQNYDPQENSPGKRFLLHSVINSKYKKIYYFEVEPWMSGTGGSTGYILSTDFKGDNANFLDSFTSEEQGLIDSIQFSPDANYLVFTNISYNGGCVNRRSNIINIKDDVLLTLQVPKTEKYTRKSLIPFDDLIPTRWLGNNILEIETPFNVCYYDSSSDIIQWQTWQYNLETEEYKLTSENE